VALGYGATLGTIRDSSDIGGRVAAANTVDLSAVGQSLMNDPYGSLAGGYLVVAGGGVVSGDDITLLSNGNAYAPGSAGSNFSLHAGGSLVTTGPSPIDFTNLRTTLDAESLYLGSLMATGQALTSGEPGFPSGANPSWLVLLGNNATLNVFSLTATQLASSQLDIVVPSGATAIINVSGSASNPYALNSQININGSQLSNTSDAAAEVLFNFDDATSVSLNAEINGAVLAPFAEITGGSEIDGTVIGAQIDDNGEADNAEFIGYLPWPSSAAPEPGSLILFATGLAWIALLLRRKSTAKPVLDCISPPAARGGSAIDFVQPGSLSRGHSQNLSRYSPRRNPLALLLSLR